MASNSRKKIIWIIVLAILLIVVYNATALFDKVVRKTVDLAINSINTKKELVVSIDKVDVSIRKGSISLEGLNFVPDSAYFENFKSGKVAKIVVPSVHISKIELTGLNMKSVFMEGRLNAVRILVNDVTTSIYLRNQKGKTVPNSSEPPTSALDSLRLKGLKSVNFGSIQVNNYQVNLLNVSTKDTISSFIGDHFELDGVDFEKREGGSDIFDIHTENLVIAFKDQRLKLPKNEFEITLGALEFRNSEQILKMENFSFHPVKSLEHLASQRKYADNFTAGKFKNLTVYGIDIPKYHENHLASVKKVTVEGMHLNLLKNKQKPEDFHARPLLPNQILKQLEIPIHIEEIDIIDGSLTYKEIQPKNPKDIVIINLTHMNGHVKYVTSIKDSFATGTPLTVALQLKILGKTNVHFDVNMPYNNHNNGFTYKGRVGAADMKLFTPIIFPVARVNIEKGHMESMEFSFHATPHQSNGELKMRYSDLAVDIPLKHKAEEHTLSFLANSAIHKFNPKKNGKMRVATISYDRIPYKGLGGFVVKSILEGVTHTIAPFGSHENNKDEMKNKVKTPSPTTKNDKGHKKN